jgi:beta-glucosidase-like glycosyl hydrolase
MFKPLLLALCALPLCSGQTVPANTVTYDTRACQPPHDTYPFCNPELSLDERVNDLIERIWVVANETIPLLLTARSMGKNNISALGIPEYDFGMNAIHGVQSSCLSDGDGTHCPTSFANPVNFGSTWNKTGIFELGRTVGIEGRALWLAGAVEQSPRNHIGLDSWSPNINIARLATWGRTCEVASEDPMLNADFGTQYTRGVQYPGLDSQHVAIVSTLKHWDA